MADELFLGRGWGFPVTFGNQGRLVTMVDAEEDIRQSLEILLSTQVGERVLNPTFGWKRDALVFERSQDRRRSARLDEPGALSRQENALRDRRAPRGTPDADPPPANSSTLLTA